MPRIFDRVEDRPRQFDDLPSVSTTELAGAIQKVTAQAVVSAGAVLVTRHEEPAMVLSIDRYRQPTKAAEPDLTALTQRFDDLVARMWNRAPSSAWPRPSRCPRGTRRGRATPPAGRRCRPASSCSPASTAPARVYRQCRTGRAVRGISTRTSRRASSPANPGLAIEHANGLAFGTWAGAACSRAARARQLRLRDHARCAHPDRPAAGGRARRRPVHAWFAGLASPEVHLQRVRAGYSPAVTTSPRRRSVSATTAAGRTCCACCRISPRCASTTTTPRPTPRPACAPEPRLLLVMQGGRVVDHARPHSGLVRPIPPRRWPAAAEAASVGARRSRMTCR